VGKLVKRDREEARERRKDRGENEKYLLCLESIAKIILPKIRYRL